MHKRLTPPAEAEEERFRYGWRYVTRVGADGRTVVDEVPLTLEDVLHPREGDVIPENTLHEPECTYLENVAEARLAGRKGWLVLSDCLIDWGVKRVQPMSPDLALIPNVADPKQRRGTFRVKQEGTAPVLVVEITSPDTRDNDVRKKLRLYHRVGVPLYVIVDEEYEGAPRKLLAYRHTPKGYEPVPLDDQGRLYLDVLGVYLTLRDNRLVCCDGKTGEVVGNYAAVDKARREAEQRERKEARARKAAERRASKEAEARQAAEQRVRELEAELRRLRGEA
jgi:Uma2 family endonuclease